ncbi:MAG: DUF6265 family protein [Flavobacteriales bacterium]
MQRIWSVCFYSVFFLVFLSCGEEEKCSGEFDLKRLEGDWLFMHESTQEMAQWRQDGKGGLSGTGYVLDENDTTFIEFLQIRRTSSGLVYTASASRLDTVDRVPYTLINETTEKLEFFNAGYGFPQKVVFDLPDDSTLYFYIEGPQEQKKVRINFIYQKQK